MDSQSPFPRLFTVDEANALLPTLRPIIERILETIRRLRAKSETVIREESIDPESPNLMSRLRENQEIAAIIGQVKGYVDEIHSYGCLCKGVEQGLLDFPCMLGTDVVFLCWQYGEPSIAYWHRIEDGFAGRRPLLDPEEAGSGGKTSFH
ncbi:MAG TPA: DUF2203 domain-containing protein [candidate division Zixibacteria bacterium]|nr:DUF2203 domain-containing protein [candidate division Zixibacteria bacterium]